MGGSNSEPPNKVPPHFKGLVSTCAKNISRIHATCMRREERKVTTKIARAQETSNLHRTNHTTNQRPQHRRVDKFIDPLINPISHSLSC